MGTIRDVVHALGQHDGVETVVVLGRDGLRIDSFTKNGSDPDGVAAMVPSVVDAGMKLGVAGACGDFTAGVMEYGDGLVVVSVVTPDALIAIVVQSDTNVGGLLYELRRYRAAIADLL